MALTNGLAYSAALLITTRKRFIVLAPVFAAFATTII